MARAWGNDDVVDDTCAQKLADLCDGREKVCEVGFKDLVPMQVAAAEPA